MLILYHIFFHTGDFALLTVVIADHYCCAIFNQLQ